jgi:hypothetical protein
MRAPVRHPGFSAAVALFVLLTAGSLVSAAQDRNRHVVAAPDRPALEILGHARGLYPGASQPMRLVVWNRTDRDLRVVLGAARVRSNRVGCPPSALRVGPARDALLVPAHGRVRSVVPVRLRRSAPDACQGARFRVTFVARGR